ncbi:MAG: hypothetical protein AEth_00154 [Candidatus Argoarchaeum ethanivorans]|uniref:Transmembrane protein n=1 Tax=Candidatus Argoarchaeum ethanivorans TaxID=2608793 RepID=A0A8B3SAF5_9EURY|nr:MAG: hypothetical protein AEth_00154 [Candidatus Argoarchaeum ethanivorans]
MVAFILSHTSRNRIKAISDADKKGTSMKEEDKINKEENLLSPAEWIMFLSGEISTCWTCSLPLIAIGFAFMLVCLTGTITLFNSGKPGWWSVSLILVAFVVVTAFLVNLWYKQVNKKVKPLERIRDQILCGDLKEYDEIYKEYKCVKRFT